MVIRVSGRRTWSIEFGTKGCVKSPSAHNTCRPTLEQNLHILEYKNIAKRH